MEKRYSLPGNVESVDIRIDDLLYRLHGGSYVATYSIDPYGDTFEVEGFTFGVPPATLDEAVAGIAEHHRQAVEDGTI